VDPAGLLAYGKVNEIVLKMAREVVPVVRRTPVLAGINGRGPLCLFDAFLEGLKRMILVHGAPVAEAEDAEFTLASTKNCHGFYGAYSIERLLTEKAMVERTKRFKAIPSARKM
jgi:predicted TIM-barrel enzyme